MCTRVSVQIEFTEIENMFFPEVFQWRIRGLDEEGDAEVSYPPPPRYFVI